MTREMIIALALLLAPMAGSRAQGSPQVPAPPALIVLEEKLGGGTSEARHANPRHNPRSQLRRRRRGWASDRQAPRARGAPVGAAQSSHQ